MGGKLGSGVLSFKKLSLLLCVKDTVLRLANDIDVSTMHAKSQEKHDPIADAKAQEATYQYEFRVATPADIPALQQMIGNSLRALGKGYYTQAELDGSIGYLFGPDSVLIHDQ